LQKGVVKKINRDLMQDFKAEIFQRNRPRKISSPQVASSG
jgi:hypothetical protein